MKSQNKYQRSWTPARRAAAAERARINRPWRFSTGPRTAAGKAKVARNGHKHGLHSAAFRPLKDALRRQNHFLRTVRRAIQYQRKLIRAQARLLNTPTLKTSFSNPLRPARDTELKSVLS